MVFPAFALLLASIAGVAPARRYSGGRGSAAVAAAPARLPFLAGDGSREDEASYVASGSAWRRATASARPARRLDGELDDRGDHELERRGRLWSLGAPGATASGEAARLGGFQDSLGKRRASAGSSHGRSIGAR